MIEVSRPLPYEIISPLDGQTILVLHCVVCGLLTRDFWQYSWDISFTVRGNIDAKSEEEAKEKAIRLILKTFPYNLYGIGIISTVGLQYLWKTECEVIGNVYENPELLTIIN